MDALDTVAGVTELSLGRGTKENVAGADALKAFEAYFVGELLRIAAPKSTSDLFDGGQAGRMYREHFHQELARLVAEHGGMGLATSLAGSLEPGGEREKGERANADGDPHDKAEGATK